jgi:FMN phosphatase YigB (HAD superfamily)
MNILTDLDGTILDIVRLVDDFKQLMMLHGIPRERIEAYYASDPIDPVYLKNPSRTYYLLAKPDAMGPLFNLNGSQIEKLRFEMGLLINRMREYIFPEAWGYMESTRRENSILITYGWTAFQQLKIQLSGIASNFSQIIITDGKLKTDMIAGLKSRGVIDDSQIFLVDDRGKEITEIKADHPEVVAIWVYRDHNNRNHECAEARDYKVHDLAEADALIHLLSTTAQSRFVKVT